MATEQKGIYFTELTLENVRCFGDKAVLKLHNDKGEWSRWNVILGDNGTGKTTLLRCLAFLTFKSLGDSRVYLDIINFQGGIVSNRNAELHTHICKLYGKLFDEVNKENRTLSSLLTRESYGDTAEEYSIACKEGGEKFIRSDFFVIGYGANRSIDLQPSLDEQSQNGHSSTLFNDSGNSKLIGTEEWLLQMDYAASRDSEIKELAIKRRNLIIESLKDILPDVADIRFKSATTIDRPVPRLEFKTSFGWVGVRQLSHGYKTMVAWIVDVAARMFKRYPESDNPLEEPVIILVDEIDLHLHPKWQRQIFDFLETRFPRAQFVVTAHSPLIVQSAPKDANIIVLRKERVGEENVVVIDNDIESVNTWRIDQIMSSDIFGLDTSRSREVELQLLRRTDLIQKAVLTEAEGMELERLNELANGLPTADSVTDIEAMQLIREAASFFKQQKPESNDTNQK